jgi:alanine or glycine:cation symporter, AGCS family
MGGDVRPSIEGDGIYKTYVGATLTAKALDTVADGLGKWLITVASWLFGVSTMIAWAYYGEQGITYLAGEKGVLPFKFVYLALIILATLGHIQTASDLDNVTGIGLGVMMWANIPICWIFGYQAMRAYREYVGRLKSGRMTPDHPRPHLDDLISGRDVNR